MATTNEILYGQPVPYRATATVKRGDLVLHDGRPAIVESETIRADETGNVFVRGPFLSSDEVDFPIAEGAAVFYDFAASRFVPEGTPGAVRVGCAELPCNPNEKLLVFMLNG